MLENDKWEICRTKFPNNSNIHPYENRSYALFAMLAGINNTPNDGITPIDQPRGIPADASSFYLKETADGGGHSYSYLTLQELLNYDYSKPSIYEGWVYVADYGKYKNEGIVPTSWCGGIGGTNVFRLTLEQADEFLDNEERFWEKYASKLIDAKVSWAERNCPGMPHHEGVLDLQKHYQETKEVLYSSVNVKMQWKVPSDRYIDDEWFNLLEQLKTLAPKGNYEHIRLVFFFDN